MKITLNWKHLNNQQPQEETSSRFKQSLWKYGKINGKTKRPSWKGDFCFREDWPLALESANAAVH